MTRLAALTAILALPLAAQLPFPYPTGEAKIPSPRHHGRHKGDQAQQQIIEADGVTVSNDSSKLVVHTPDGRWLTMTVTPETKFTQNGSSISASGIAPGKRVHVSAAEDDQANLTAVTVELLKNVPAPAPTPAEGPAAASKPARSSSEAPVPGDQPAILTPPDAPGAPILRHGKPHDASLYGSSTSSSDVSAPAKQSDGNFDFTITSPTPSPAVHARFDALVEKARSWVANFTSGLPNYLCNQDTTRYVQESRDSEWEAQDVVTAKVIYDHGREQYSDITVGGRKTKKSMMQLGGQTSTGEFASLLYSLFNPGRQAEFTFKNSGSADDRPVAIYNFKVLLPRSDWSIIVGGQLLRPAYSGTVWIDRKSAVVRRLQMQANNIPHDFPMDYVETAVDYDMVSLGAQQFLLPIHASNISCERGSTVCAKNTIDFRDYHKFEGSSTITYGK